MHWNTTDTGFLFSQPIFSESIQVWLSPLFHPDAIPVIQKIHRTKEIRVK